MSLLRHKRELSGEILYNDSNNEEVTPLFLKWFKALNLITTFKIKFYQLVSQINNFNNPNPFDCLYNKDNDADFFMYYKPFLFSQSMCVASLFKSKMKSLCDEVKNNHFFQNNLHHYWDLTNDIPIHMFNDSINITELLVLLGKRILKLNEQFDEESCEKLKILFQCIKEPFINSINEISKSDGVNSLKLSLLVSILGFFDYEECKSLSIIKDDYCIPIFNNNCYKLQFNYSTIPFTKATLLKYLLSPLLLEVYDKLLTQKNKKIQNSKLIKLIKDIVYDTHFFFIPNQNETFGYTIENGNIYIEKPAIIGNNIISVFDSATLLSTIYHEISHSLLQKVINLNFFVKHAHIKGFQDLDSGEFIEYLLFHNVKHINRAKALYILDLNQYSQTCEHFFDNFQIIKENKTDSTINFRKKKNKKCNNNKQKVEIYS